MKQRTRQMHHGDDLSSYNMGNAKKEDADDHSEIQLHRIKQDHFIEAQIQEGDTLQAIALRFHCSLSELKRINHIHKDNEIFARRTIKVPITPYSVLTEMIPIETQAVPSTSSQTTNASQELIHNSLNGPVRTEQKDDDCAIDCNEIVLNSTLAPAVISYTDVDTAEQVSEDTQLLPNKEKVSVEAVVVKQLTSQGADFGCKWFQLLCFVLILGFLVPLIYVLFFLEKHEPDLQDLPPLHQT